MPNVLVFLVLFAAPPAAAQQTQVPGHPRLDCYCRAEGRIFAPGETICLKTAEGLRLAQCRMEINVMSWSITSRPCPEA